LKRTFRPEFLNRLDEIVIFTSLSREELRRIVDLQLESLNRTLAGRRIHLEATPEAREKLLEIGYDPQYGARPLRPGVGEGALRHDRGRSREDRLLRQRRYPPAKEEVRQRFKP
jgi:ATP-dependent protease Clp ATPase subunit